MRPNAKQLVLLCRALKHGLGVGFPPGKVFDQQSRTGPASLRPLMARIADRLEEGETLGDALKPEAGTFPNLFVELVDVGEKSGRLTDIFDELEVYFESVVSTRRRMSMLLIWPLIEYFGAIFVITLLIFIMGMIGTQDVLGWGLTGTKGALIFLGGMMAFTAVLFFGYRYIRDTPAMQAKVEAFLLPIPILGSCFRTFALQRFCSALYMTNEAGFDSGEMVRSSLRAATNQRYLDIANDSCKQVRKGREISEVLAVHGTRLFPDDLIQSIHLGEETGSLAEVMKKEMIRFREEAGRQMLILALIFTAFVILLIASFIIFMIYSIYTHSIGPMYNSAIMAADDPQKWMQQGNMGQLQEHINAPDDPQKWLRGGR